jgi:gamma-glutamylcyclotransferase (GGCT)/AIG2-like uncharacterized protein YtfP
MSTSERAERPLFVYGTLLYGPVLDRVLGRRPEMCWAAAPGFAARKMPGVVWPGMIELKDTVAGGILLLDLSVAELESLDQYEGEPYWRAELTVVDDRGRTVEAHAYVVEASDVTDEEWSSRWFYDEQLEAFLAELDGGSLSQG